MSCDKRCGNCKFFILTTIPRGVCELLKGMISENVHVYNHCSNFIIKPIALQQKEAFDILKKVRHIKDGDWDDER